MTALIESHRIDADTKTEARAIEEEILRSGDEAKIVGPARGHGWQVVVYVEDEELFA